MAQTAHPPTQRSVCSSCSPRAEHGGQVVTARGHREASYANYRHGADRCSMAGMGVGAGSLKILAGVLVHRATRPLRGSVSCGSGWSVPCVSIQLTLSQQEPGVIQASTARTDDEPRANDKQRGEQASSHACVAPSPCRPIFPCRMPPYSHADIPFKFPHRNSGGPANAYSTVGSLVSYKSLSPLMSKTIVFPQPAEAKCVLATIE